MAQVVLPQQALLEPGARSRTQHEVPRALVIVRHATTAISIFVIAVALILGTLARTSGAGAVRLFGHEIRPVLSGSMTPAFRVGDAVVTNVASPSRIAAVSAGDVIVFRVPQHESMVVAHRVVKVATNSQGVRLFTTKGDANAAEDGVLVDQAHVIGVVSNSVPYIGRVMVSLEQRRTLFIFLFSAILAGFSVAMARRARRYALEHDPHLAHHGQSSPPGDTEPSDQFATHTSTAHTQEISA